MGEENEKKKKKQKKPTAISPASLKDALEYYSFKVSSYLLPGRYPKVRSTALGDAECTPPLLLTYRSTTFFLYLYQTQCCQEKQNQLNLPTLIS